MTVETARPKSRSISMNFCDITGIFGRCNSVPVRQFLIRSPNCKTHITGERGDFFIEEDRQSSSARQVATAIYPSFVSSMRFFP